ncbi:MAG: major facilitator superfamily 1 [Deltaproteobacteria bacterium]|nr:major facilitator superfamily 1 [Deltaproteobacteria bacterium]
MVIYLCMLSYTLVLQSIPPVLSLIIDELGLSYHQAGVLMSLFALPGILVSLPAGMLADRYGVKRVGIASLLFTIAGTIMVATGQTFISLTAGRVIAGTGAISLIVIAPQGIVQWFRNRELGVAMGIYNTALPVGVIVSLNALPPLASQWGWRSGTWAAATFSVPKLGREHVLIGLVALSWALFNTCIVSLNTFAPDFMVGRGLSLQSAGFYTSLFVVGPLCLSPLVGYAVDRIGYPEAFMAAGGLGMAILLPLIPAGIDYLALLMLAVGIWAALVPAPAYYLTADIARHERLGFGFGVLSMLNNAGVFVGPQLVGLSRDVSGSYTAGFGLMALFAVLSAVVAVMLWAKRRRQETH